MIQDIRKLKPGMLLRATNRVDYFIKNGEDIVIEVIEENQIVMFLEHDIKKGYDPLMIYKNIEKIRLKLLIGEVIQWVIVGSHRPEKKGLPKDIVDTNFACPLFDIVSSS